MPFTKKLLALCAAICLIAVGNTGATSCEDATAAHNGCEQGVATDAEVSGERVDNDALSRWTQDAINDWAEALAEAVRGEVEGIPNDTMPIPCQWTCEDCVETWCEGGQWKPGTPPCCRRNCTPCPL